MHDIATLYERFLAGQCSREELQALLTHFEQQGSNTALLHRITDILEQEDSLTEADIRSVAPLLDHNWRVIQTAIAHRVPRRSGAIPLRKILAYAAILLAVCTIGIAGYLLSQREPTSVLTSKYGEDAQPGGQFATLSLDDGRTIRLDTLAPGTYRLQAGIEIEKKTDGSLVYTVQEESARPAAPFNTISTPPGGTYRIQLPDGSTVWLNAEASLRYPVVFTGDERQVTLAGEAFFEITPDAARPFIVSTGDQHIRVLGTTFNVSAYPREPTVTTLVTGKVRLEQDGQRTDLQPRQQARWNGRSFDVATVDVEPFTAWKDGWFIFHDVPLTNIMQQLSRWYAIEVDYTNMPDRPYYAEISRNVPLSAVLEMIEADGAVAFELKGGILRVK